jgi:dienelactone hydrolase
MTPPKSSSPNEAWWNSLRTAPARVPDKADRCRPVLENIKGHRITDAEDWQHRRSEILRKWSEYLGTIDAPETAPKFEVIESDSKAGVLRELVRYEAESGLPVEGYLLRPLPESGGKFDRKRPVAVVLHSTVDYTIRQPAGLEGPETKWIGLKLAQAGYLAFCPRCYLWQYGEPKDLRKAVTWLHRRHPGIRGMTKMVFDARRAVDLLLSLPDADPNRVVAIGHSLGAKEALYLAAFDDRVRATVSSEGGIGIGYSNWEAPWYLDSEIKHRADLNHAELLACVAPRAFLLMGGDSADGDLSWPYIEATLPIWKLTGEPAGVGLWNHRQGHAFPPESMSWSLEWFARFLR